jgi:hypothetical protein
MSLATEDDVHGRETPGRSGRVFPARAPTPHRARLVHVVHRYARGNGMRQQLSASQRNCLRSRQPDVRCRLPRGPELPCGPLRCLQSAGSWMFDRRQVGLPVGVWRKLEFSRPSPPTRRGIERARGAPTRPPPLRGGGEFASRWRRVAARVRFRAQRLRDLANKISPRPMKPHEASPLPRIPHPQPAFGAGSVPPSSPPSVREPPSSVVPASG